MRTVPVCGKAVPHFRAMPLALLSILAIVLYVGAAALLAAPMTGCPRTPRRLGLATATVAVLLHAEGYGVTVQAGPGSSATVTFGSRSR